MKKLLQTLTEAFGPAGYEDEVRGIVRTAIKPCVDEMRVDALGNLIAHKRPGKAAKDIKKIMVAAHMDEIGMMVSHVDENGFVRFAPLGRLLRQYAPGGTVRFLNGTRGVIGLERLPNGKELPGLDKFYIDVGARSRDDCPVQVGDVAAFEGPYRELGDRLVAKSMDGRAGALVAIETLRNLKAVPYDLYFAFTARHEVGLQGAVPAAYDVAPELAIVLDVCLANDTPQAQGTGIALGKGPCVKIQDAGMIADARIVRWMVAAAEKNKIPYQREVSKLESSDALEIQSVRAGIPVGCISIPVRYLHSPAEMMEFMDVQNAIKLLTALLHTPIEL